jgi:hypothetical protein
MDPGIAQSGDSGKVFIYHSSKTPTGIIMQDIIDQITEPDKTKKVNA